MKARRVPGEPGIWLVVIGDIVVFAVLFGMYLHYRHDHAAEFAMSQARLTPAFGFVDTLLLLTSSLAVVERRLGISALLGVAFCASKALEWTLKVHHGMTPDTNDFFQLYFVMTGLHLLHVVVGITVLLAVRKMGDVRYVEAGGVFWHMVDLLWLILFPLLYFVH